MPEVPDVLGDQHQAHPSGRDGNEPRQDAADQPLPKAPGDVGHLPTQDEDGDTGNASA